MNHKQNNLTKKELFYKARFVFRKNKNTKLIQDGDNYYKDPVIFKDNDTYMEEQIREKQKNKNNLSFERYFRTSAGNQSRKESRNIDIQQQKFQLKQQNYFQDKNNNDKNKFILQNHQQFANNTGYQWHKRSQSVHEQNRSLTNFQQELQQQQKQQLTNRTLTPHVPSINFGKMASRKPFLIKNTAEDERRFNNFNEFQCNKNETINLDKRPERDWKIFDIPIQDQYYENANKQYLKAVYQDKLKCTFKFDKEQQQVNRRCDFGKTQYDSQPDPTDVLQALDKVLPRNLKNGIRMNLMSGRDSPSIFGLKLFKESEREFHQQKRKQPLKRNKRLYSHQ